MPNQGEYRSVFIVSSPLQAMCALEAAYVYNVVWPVFVILSDRSTNNEGTINILHKYGILDLKILNCSSFYQVVTELKSFIRANDLNQFYDNLFVGDFLNPTQRYFALNFFKRVNKLIYLDDGNSTIEVFKWGNLKPKLRSLSYLIKASFVDVIILFCSKVPTEFFSMFNGDTSKFVCRRNRLSLFKSNPEPISPKGVFILGSNICEIGLLRREQYENALKVILKSVTEKYQSEQVFYCPHRGERIDEIEKLLKKFGMTKYTSSWSLEIGMLHDNICPMATFSFGSTASYSLKLIFPKVDTYFSLVQTRSATFNRSYRLISKHYLDNGLILLN